MGAARRLPGRAPPRAARAYKRPHGVRHLLAAYDLKRDRLCGHINHRKGRTEFLAFCRYIRSLYPPDVRLAFVLDNFSPHLTTKTAQTTAQSQAERGRNRTYQPPGCDGLPVLKWLPQEPVCTCLQDFS